MPFMCPSGRLRTQETMKEQGAKFCSRRCPHRARVLTVGLLSSFSQFFDLKPKGQRPFMVPHGEASHSGDHERTLINRYPTGTIILNGKLLSYSNHTRISPLADASATGRFAQRNIWQSVGCRWLA